MEGEGSRGRARLRAVDHEDVGVAAFAPLAGPGREPIDRLGVIARRLILPHPLEPGVGEVGGVGLDQGVIVGIFEDDRDVARPADVEELVVAKAFVPRLDRMAQADAVKLRGEQVNEAPDVIAVEYTTRRELPQ